MNVHKERFIAASYDLDLEQFSLDRHKPKSMDLKFENNKFKADVLCEMTFLYNFFTGNPQGVLRIEVLAVNFLGFLFSVKLTFSKDSKASRKEEILFQILH